MASWTGRARLGAGATLVVAFAAALMIASCDEGLSAECEEYLDVQHDPVSIVVENKRSTPIYFANVHTCDALPSFALTDPAGNSVSTEVLFCDNTCQALMEGYGCGGGECFGEGFLVMLGPGASAEISWAATRHESRSLPAECVPYSETSTEVTCDQLVDVDPGTYTVFVDVVTSAMCVPFENEGNGDPHPCVCTASSQSGPGATCSIFEEFTLGDEEHYEAALDYPNERAVTITVE